MNESTYIVTPKCSIYRSNYVEEVKEKRKQQIQNPDFNHCVLLRNVDICESETDIKEMLKDLGYEIEDVQRFKSLPIVKVTLSSGEAVKRILSDNSIYIGYRLATCELFDPYRRRPRSFFK